MVRFTSAVKLTLKNSQKYSLYKDLAYLCLVKSTLEKQPKVFSLQKIGIFCATYVDEDILLGGANEPDAWLISWEQTGWRVTKGQKIMSSGLPLPKPFREKGGHMHSFGVCVVDRRNMVATT